MASNIGDYLAHVIINDLIIATLTPHLSLHTAAVGDGGAGTEVAGDTYVRQDLTLSAETEGDRHTHNAAEIAYAEAGASWGTVGWVGIWNAVTAGNLIAWGAVTTAKLITVGDTAIVAAGALTLTFVATP